MAPIHKRHWIVVGPAVFYHRPSATLYIAGEVLVDMEGLPRTTESIMKVCKRAAVDFCYENGGVPLKRAVVLGMPGILVIEVTEPDGPGGDPDLKFTEGGPHGAA